MLLVFSLYRSKIHHPLPKLSLCSKRGALLNGLQGTLLLIFQRHRWTLYRKFSNLSLFIYAISKGSSHRFVGSRKNRILVILKLRKFYWSIFVILLHLGQRRNFLSILRRCMRVKKNGRWIRKFSNTIGLHGILIKRNERRYFSCPLTLSLLKRTMELKVKISCLNTRIWNNIQLTKSLCGVLSVIIEKFIPNQVARYNNVHSKLSNQCKKYNQEIPEFLHNRPLFVIKYAYERYATAKNVFDKDDIAKRWR